MHMGVQTGAKFGDAFADAVGLQRSKASESSEAWRARMEPLVLVQKIQSEPWFSTGK